MNTLKKQFSDAFKREGKTITTYYKSESVKCLFRKNDDGNNTDNHVTIFYDISAPIKQGMLLSYGGETFLTMSKETIENGVYYKSSLIKCNLLLPMTINNVKTSIPCYAYDLNTMNLDEGKFITLLDGNGEIITEATEPIINIDLSGTKIIRVMGRYLKVINAYNINGISHVFTEVTTKPADKFAMDMTSPKTDYKINDTSQITVVFTNNDEELTGQTMTYVSSDITIATVSTTGLVTFLSGGAVTITGTWVEHNTFTDTITFAVEMPVPSLTITQMISGDILINGRVRTITATVKNGDGTVNTTEPITFTFTLPTGYASLFTILYPTVRTATIKCANTDDYDKLIGKTVDVSIKDTATGTATSTASYKIKM